MSCFQFLSVVASFSISKRFPVYGGIDPSFGHEIDIEDREFSETEVVSEVEDGFNIEQENTPEGDTSWS